MPEVENDYVATATAEKRLREVLAHQFHDAGFLDDLSAVLLAGAEITYLPRKKSVSIVLRVPATAGSKPVRDANGETKEEREDGFTWADKQAYDESQLAKAYSPVDNNPGNDDSIPELPRVARFGLFTPTSTDESDYFTE